MIYSVYRDHSDRSDPSDCKTHAMMTSIPWYLVFAGAWGASPPPAASSPPPPQLPSLALFSLAPMQNLSSTLAMRRGGLEIFFLLTERNFLAPWFIHENITGEWRSDQLHQQIGWVRPAGTYPSLQTQMIDANESSNKRCHPPNTHVSFPSCLVAFSFF